MKNNFLKTIVLVLGILAAGACRSQPVALLQIIHNSADPSLDSIDIYYNGMVQDSNMLFRTAILFYITPDTATTITIAHKHSTSAADSIRSFYFSSFNNNETYVLMIKGLDSTGFEANPNGISTALSMDQISQIDTVSPDTANFAFKLIQGATDLPTMKIIQRLNDTLVFPDVQYGDTTAYIQLHHDLYELQLISADSSQNFGTYIVDLTGYGGQVGIVFTSGFLNPMQNDSGPPLGLYMALPSGTVVPFVLETSAFQLIHNCADTAADSVDVYINGILAYHNFAFRNATPALSLFAYALYDVALAPKNSTSVSDTFWHHIFTMQPDTFYIATMTGLINPGTYTANPDGINTAFQVLVKSPAEYTGSSQVNFDFFLINGATDAPPLQLIPEGGPPVITHAVYAGMSNYISFPPDFYTLNLQDTTGNLIGTYFANFPGFSGQSGVLLVSGFLNPATNNNGADAGLYLVPIAGGPFVPLFLTTGIHTVSENKGLEIFPNPASKQIFIRPHTPAGENASLQITGMNGQTMKSILNDATLSSGETVAVDVSNLSAGLYILKLTTSGTVSNYKLVIAR